MGRRYNFRIQKLDTNTGVRSLVLKLLKDNNALMQPM